MTVASGISTALTEKELNELALLAEGKVVLEVGSWWGASTIAMATTAKLVVAVDWHQGDAHAGYENTEAGFLANLDLHGARGKVIPMIGRSEDVLPLLRAEAFDLAFIDAYHTLDAVTGDAGMVWPLVKPGGLIAFHDYGLTQFGVTEAVDRIADAVTLIDTLAVVRRH